MHVWHHRVQILIHLETTDCNWLKLHWRLIRQLMNGHIWAHGYIWPLMMCLYMVCLDLVLVPRLSSRNRVRAVSVEISSAAPFARRSWFLPLNELRTARRRPIGAST
jgi:hypothetical protein